MWRNFNLMINLMLHHWFLEGVGDISVTYYSKVYTPSLRAFIEIHGQRKNLNKDLFEHCLFAENWKFIIKNTVTKYFLNGKILFMHFCALTCPETVPWDQPKNANADPLLNKCTLR